MLTGQAVTGTLVRPDLLMMSGYELQPVAPRTGPVRTLLLRGERVRAVEFRRVP
jgi:hypothetical protein